jgi:integrase
LFCLYYDLPFPSISIHTLLSFIEFLNDNSLSVPTIRNYVSSIKSKFLASSIPVGVFDSPQCTLTLTSLSNNWTPSLTIKPVLNPTQFSRLVARASSLPLHVFYRVAFIFAYMALLCISNIAPPSFDPLRHLHWGDVTIHSKFLQINLRWTKTLQKYRQSAIIKLFPIPNSSLCPLQALRTPQRGYPMRHMDPFLSYRSSGRLFLVTQSDLRRALKMLVTALNFHFHSITFHSFRRSGASLAYTYGMPFDAIQAHGTWASDALWC